VRVLLVCKKNLIRHKASPETGRCRCKKAELTYKTNGKNHMLLPSLKTAPNLMRQFFHAIDPKPALKRYRRKKAMKLFYGEFRRQ
jgi:hypothetical protein